MNSTVKQQVEQQLGKALDRQASIEALREFHSQTAYCEDGQGNPIGLVLCGTELERLVLPKDWNTLQYLNLRDNEKLHTLVFESSMPQLEHLDASDSGLTVLKLPQNCDRLRYLDGSRNKISQFVPLRDFPSLEHLDLSNNQLNDFDTRWLSKFPKLQRVYLQENPMYSSKRDGVERPANCLDFLQRFQRDLEKGEPQQNKEYKVLVVGNGGVGKSCLVERLVHNTFTPSHDSTHGVSIEQCISLEQYLEQDKFPYILNIWDFGGQDIYHATHRLFMQSNAIYYVLWDEENNPDHKKESAYQEGKETRTYDNHSLQYWLYYVQQQGKNSPVIVIKTKKAKNNAPSPHEPSLFKTFSNTFKRLDFHQVESSESDWQQNGFKRLLNFTEDAISSFGRDELLPQNWFNLRQHLRNLQKNNSNKVLSLQEYLDIASDYALENPIEVLEKWLVPTGVVFYREGYFGNAIILQQDWAIRAIYTLFQRQGNVSYYTIMYEQKGRFSGAQLRQVWKQYSEVECELFLGFMLSCELCFEVETEKDKDSSKSFEERQFVAPQLMQKTPPATVVQFREGKPKRLFIRYQHTLLHYGIIQSFIVRTQYLAELRDIWQNGIIIAEQGTSALIQKVGETIQVELEQSALPLLAKIRNLLEDLQKEADFQVHYSLDGTTWVDAKVLAACETGYLPTLSNQVLPKADFQVFLDKSHEQKQFESQKVASHTQEDLLERWSKEQLPALLVDVPKTINFEGVEKICLLFLAANPSKTSEISWEKEHTLIAEKVRESKKCEVIPVGGVDLDAIIDAVEDRQPHVIHFCGHGKEASVTADGRPTTGGIILHDKRKGQNLVDASVLKRQFQAFKDDNPNLKLVFLNACHSQTQAKAISELGLITIGTTDEIVSAAAQDFASGFYRYLSQQPEVDILVALQKGKTRAARHDENLDELISVYSNGVKIF